MSGNQKGRAPGDLWSLEQAMVWIETRAGVPQHLIHRQIAPTTMQELYQALKAGMITASGCIDGGERRDISPGEWNDYRLKLGHAKFSKHYYMGSAGTPNIAVLSIHSFPAAALKYHGHRSGVRIPSAQSPDGESGYHRGIDDVLLRREEVVEQWPAIGQPLSHHDRLPERARRRPALERTQRVINELYPDDDVPDQAAVPNSKLCYRVRQKLKEAHLPDVSDDTILRAAGRRSR